MEDQLLAEAADANVDTSSRTADLMITDDLMLDLAFPLMDSDFAAPSPLIQMPSMSITKPDWFLAPETWKISHEVGTSASVGIGKATLKKYLADVQSWFELWVTTGSCPFIHTHLYSANFPACVQVAYATLASYIYRTPANEDKILQIVEDRSNDLLQEDGEQDIDLFAQLARLHALMVYQIIGLLDGDIRSRYVAEGHMAVQKSWASKLLHSAARGLSSTRPDAMDIVDRLSGPLTYSQSQQQWYLWILSESIRRAWLVALSVSSVFTALQQRGAICPGGIMYTNRSGLWNATSAPEWENLCLEKNVACLQRFGCPSVFDYAAPADIDEFGTTLLDMNPHRELLEKWKERYLRTAATTAHAQ